MEKQFENRMHELAERAYSSGKYIFSDFLSEGECTQLCAELGKFSYAAPKLFGGAENCVRKIVRFGEGKYGGEFPITTLKISPKNARFSETLSHRDILGATLSLGIERDLVGDIFVKGSEAFLFCHKRIAPFLLENLVRIRHTDIVCTVHSEEITAVQTRRTECYFTSSLRRDCVIAAVFHLSRTDVKEAFGHELVSLNGMPCGSPAGELKAGDCIALRGKGKFYFVSSELTAKGREHITIEYPI